MHRQNKNTIVYLHTVVFLFHFTCVL